MEKNMEILLILIPNIILFYITNGILTILGKFELFLGDFG